MKVIASSMMCIAGLAACAVTGDEDVGVASQANFGNDIFYENFNSLQVGPVCGQGGWELPPGAASCCRVTAASNTDKNLDCSYDGSQNGQGALHRFITPPGRDYHFEYDVWMSGVTEATHGKVFLESGAGTGGNTIFQFASGCSAGHAGIRVTFEYGPGPVLNLLNDADCSGHYRVACNWSDHGWQLRCGASRLPADPVESQVMNTPEPIGSYNLVRVLGGIGMRRGTTTYDKIQVLSN
jgi:hypothetical protein